MLDDIDRRLIDGLVGAPRATIRALATTVPLSESCTRARVNALFDTGVNAVSTLVHPAVRGRSLPAFATIDYHADSLPDLDAVGALDEASWIARYSTGPTLFVQINHSSAETAHAFLDEISALPWVEHASLTMVFKFHASRSAARLVGHSLGPWATPASESVDRMDRALIACLRSDGRASYTSLAHRVGLSLPATRRRVIALEATGVIRFTTDVTDPETTSVHALLFVAVQLRRAGGRGSRVARLSPQGRSAEAGCLGGVARPPPSRPAAASTLVGHTCQASPSRARSSRLVAVSATCEVTDQTGIWPRPDQ